MDRALPPIPAKRYFTIGEVSELCGVKPYVLRYWEQEFTQLKPMKRRGNRRYYQHHEVLLIRRIRDLLYDQGFTISGARNRLAEAGAAARVVDPMLLSEDEGTGFDPEREEQAAVALMKKEGVVAVARAMPATGNDAYGPIREELQSIRSLLTL
jgi:DNA-binding transcriptional MerR regulator